MELVEIEGVRELISKQQKLEQDFQHVLTSNHSLQQQNQQLMSRVQSLEQSQQQLTRSPYSVSHANQPTVTALSPADKAELATVVRQLLQRQQSLEHFFQHPGNVPAEWRVILEAARARQQELLKNTQVVHDILQREIGQLQVQLAEHASRPPSPVLTSMATGLSERMRQMALTQQQLSVTQMNAARLRADVESRTPQEGAVSASCQTFQLPPPLPHKFIERQDVWQRLITALQYTQRSVITQTMAGMGGIGKTQFANYYAQQALQGHTMTPYQFIFWFYAETEIGYQFQALAKRFCGLDYISQEMAVREVYRFLTDKTALFVFDNTEKLNDLLAYLPSRDYHSALHILITSRESRETEWQGIPMFALTNFSEAETQQFVEQRLGSQPPIQVQQLHHELGGLPLALSQALSYMQKASFDITSYLQALKQGKTDLFAHMLSDDPHVQTVGVTVTLSLVQANKLHPQAEALLSVMAYLNPDAIAVSLLVELIDKSSDSVEAGLKALQAYSLINGDPTNMVSIHRLVQQALWQRDKKRGSDVSQFKQVLTVLLKHLKEKHYDPALFEAKPYLAHALYCEERLALLFPLPGDLLPLYHNLLQRLGVYYVYGIREPTAGHQWMEKALAHLPEDALEARAYAWTAISFAEDMKGRYAAAKDAALQAQRLVTPALSTSPAMAFALHQLGTLEYRQGRYESAKVYYQRALVMKQGAYEESHPDIAITLYGLGNVEYNQGRYESAKGYYQQALVMKQHAYGESHPDIAITLHALGNVEYSQGRDESAKGYYQQALAMSQRAYGESHRDIAVTLSCLANVFSRQQHIVEAQQLNKQAFAIFKANLNLTPMQSDDEFNTLPLSLEKALMKTFAEPGGYEKAKTVYQQALFICKQLVIFKTHGEQHPQRGYLQTDLATLFFKLQDYQQARILYEHALKIAEQQQNVRPRVVVERLVHLATTLLQLQHAHEALPYADRALTLAMQHSEMNSQTEKIRDLIARCQK